MSALIEPFFYCLIASMIWAPIVFLATTHFRKEDTPGLSEKLWPAALGIAALPAMVAPFAAAFGVSLRTAAPLPPMADISPEIIAAVQAEQLAASQATTVSLASVLDAAAVLYFYGFLMFLILGVARYVWFSYRVGYAYKIDEPRVEAGLEVWRKRIGIRRKPRYAFSDAVSSVCVHGFFRPVILMPHNLLDRVSADDAILMGAHEMAHIKRGDTVFFAFCTVVKAVFWFNPFMQRIAARANLAAEQAADALVIARGVDRRQYAHCFVQGLRFAAVSHRGPGAELVPSFTPFDKRSRRERLDAILSGNGGGALLSLRGKIALTASVFIAAALAFAQAALAVAPPPAEDALPHKPVDGIVSFSFGEKSPVLGDETKSHKGVDIKARRGTVVKAAGDGKVIAATQRYQGKRAWGKVVVIDHGHGLVTRYAHLDSYKVKKGDRVSAGDVIGAVGSTGKSTGPHLHFEVIQDGLHIDPTPVITAAKPMPAPAPVSAPIPSVKRTVRVAATPSVVEEPHYSKVWRVDGLEDTLSGRFENFEVRVSEVFEDFEPLEGLDELDFEDFSIDFEDFEFPDFSDMQFFASTSAEAVRDFGQLSAEDREAIREAQDEAMRAASIAMREAEREIARAKDRAEREIERAQERQERAREQQERAREQQERAREQQERARQAQEQAREQQERAREQQERAQEQRERAAEEIRRARERALEEAANREEMLALREEALADAKADLEEELAEIERMRAELNREKRTRKSE